MRNENKTEYQFWAVNGKYSETTVKHYDTFLRIELGKMFEIIQKVRGNNVAVGKNFYRSLFRKKKPKKILKKDVSELFASYKN